MKKFHFFKILVLGLVFFSLAAGVLSAQEEPSEYAYGTVARITSDSLSVVEYDYGKDSQVEIAYLLDNQVQLKNVSAVSDILVGDKVEIDYILVDGNRLAQLISVEKTLPAEPESENDKAIPSEEN